MFKHLSVTRREVTAVYKDIWMACQAFHSCIQYITTRQPHKCLIIIPLSVKTFCNFLTTPVSHPFCQTEASGKSLTCLHKVPLFLFLSHDWSETRLQRERGNTNGNISFTVHEKGKWEKRERDKENRKFAPNEKHCAAFHTGVNVAPCRTRGERSARLPLYLWCSPLFPAM